MLHVLLLSISTPVNEFSYCLHILLLLSAHATTVGTFTLHAAHTITVSTCYYCRHSHTARCTYYYCQHIYLSMMIAGEYNASDTAVAQPFQAHQGYANGMMQVANVPMSNPYYPNQVSLTDMARCAVSLLSNVVLVWSNAV